MSITTYAPDASRVVHKTSVDFIKRPVQEIIHLVQYDRSLPIIAVSLNQNGDEITLDESAIVMIRWGKKDHTYVYNTALGCDVAKHVVYFEVTDQMVLYEGLLNPTVEITVANKSANSASIPVLIERNPIQEDDVESEPSTNLLEQVIDAASSASTSATAAKTSETNAANSATEAKTYYDNIQNVLALTNGGFSVSGALSTITLLGDYSLCTSIDMLKKKWPFNILYIDTKCDSYKSDGTKLGYNDSYLVMPNCWYWADIANHAWYISNYKVNNLYQKVYPGEFKELLLAVYKATSIDSMLHSLAGYIPATNINQSTIISQLPYYKIDNKGTLRRSEYQDYRIRGLYNILSTIYLGTMNSQYIYIGIVRYSWTGSYTTDITDTDSQKTGVTEMTTSIGYLPSGNVNTGEITGTSSTTSLENGKRPFKILGVENPYGLLWENLYGLVHNSGALLSYTGNSDSLTASDLIPSSSNIIYETTGVTLPTSNGNQAEQSSVNLFNVPISIGGSTSTYTGDHYSYSDGYRILFVGGGWGGGAADGLFYLYAGYGWGYVSVSFCVRLTFER